jgi:hypothetical protein
MRYLHLNRRTTAKSLHIDYNQIDTDEIRSTCALNIDIEQIALIHARVSLGLLLEGQTEISGIPPEVNVCIFANRPIPGVIDRPLHANYHVIPRQPNCLVCREASAMDDAEARQILSTLKNDIPAP